MGNNKPKSIILKLISLIVSILMVVVTVWGLIATSINTRYSKEAGEPLFVLHTDINDEFQFVVILQNEGGPIRRVRCEHWCYAIVELTHRGTKKTIRIPFEVKTPDPRYDYERDQFECELYHINEMVELIRANEELFKYPLCEILYIKQQNELNNVVVPDDEIPCANFRLWFEDYFRISYRNNSGKIKAINFVQLSSDDFKEIAENQMPAIPETTLFSCTAFDVVAFNKYVFDQFEIPYTYDEELGFGYQFY